MFRHIPGPIEYNDPWSADYDARLRQMLAQPRRIAYFYERPNSSSFRYRAFNPGASLAADPSHGTSAAWFDHLDLAQDDAFLRDAHALVICRARYNAAIARIIARARARGIPILFDCDDLVFDQDRLHLLIDSLGLDQSDDAVWDTWFASVARTGATLRQCDAVITTNDYLRARAAAYAPGMRHAVMQNYLCQEQQSISESCYRIKRQSGWERDDAIHIGYFSGTPTHARDFAIATPALCRLMDRDPRIILRIVGFLNLDRELLRYRHRIEQLPLQDFLNLQRLIAEVEINIAPVQDNDFTNCKSELKFFEAAICGTLTLATPTSTFRDSILHEKTGLLVPSHAWDDALQHAIAIVEDTRRYDTIAQAAAAHVRSTYGWNRQAASIVRAVFGDAAGA